MPQFETHRPVPHTPEQMFDLVADVERYPEFLPLCEALAIRSRKERDGKILLVADMTAIKASEKGAYDYLPKPFDLTELIGIVGRALSEPKRKPPRQDDDMRHARRTTAIARSPRFPIACRAWSFSTFGCRAAAWMVSACSTRSRTAIRNCRS